MKTPQEQGHSALITGATGFIGSHLVRRLARDGWSVHAVVRPAPADRPQNLPPDVIVHRHDGTTEAMTSIVASAKPAVVFHLASLFLAEHQARDLEPLIRSNILFGSQVAEAMAANGVTALVNTGTSWQHFENRDYDPVCLYAATKQAFEAILRYYTAARSLKVLTLKLYDTYGPDDRRPKLFTLLRSTSREQTTLAISAGEQLLDLVYIDDVIEAFIKAAERILNSKASTWEEYAVSSGAPIRLKDLVELYGRTVGRPMPVAWGQRPYRTREVMVPWSKGRPVPGWQPITQLEEGIRRMEGIAPKGSVGHGE